jgi:hypothetical protein
MPPALSRDKTHLIKMLLELDQPHDVIATSAKCGVRSVDRIAYNLEHYSSVKRPKVVKQGRPSNLTDEMEEVCSYCCQSESTKNRGFSRS